MKKAEIVAAARLAERADVLAWLVRKGGALARSGERGDESASLMAARLGALRGDFEAGVHVGEADRG